MVRVSLRGRGSRDNSKQGMCQRSQGKRAGTEQPPFLSLYQNQEPWRPWLPENAEHPPQKPEEGGRLRRCSSQSGQETLHSRRQWNVVLARHWRERKATFSSGSGERKGSLWGEKPAPVIRKKKKSTEPPGPTEKEMDSPVRPVLKGWDGDTSKVGL